MQEGINVETAPGQGGPARLESPAWQDGVQVTVCVHVRTEFTCGTYVRTYIHMKETVTHTEVLRQLISILQKSS